MIMWHRKKTVGTIMLVALLSSSQLSAQRIRYTFEDLKDQWRKTYADDKPLLGEILDTYLTTKPSPDNFLSDTSSSVGSVKVSKSIVSWPVKNFDKTNLERYFKAQARLGLLESRLDNYVGVTYDEYMPEEKEDPSKLVEIMQERQQDYESKKLKVYLDSIVLQVASFARSNTMSQRCQYWRRANFLFNAIDISKIDSKTLGGNESAWGGYLEKVKVLNTFMTSTTIPEDLCKQSTVSSRGDTIKVLDSAIDEEITASMTEALSAFNTWLAHSNQAIGKKVKDSEIEIKGSEIFELERNFHDLLDLLDLVQCDRLGLYSSLGGNYCSTKTAAPAATETPVQPGEPKPKGPLIAQVQENIDAMNTSSVETEALRNLQTFEIFFQRLLDKLAAMPSTQGLTTAQQESLASCRLIKTFPAFPTVPPKGSEPIGTAFANFQTNYDLCLTQVAKVYKALQGSSKDDPRTLVFAQELSKLISYMNAKIAVSQ